MINNVKELFDNDIFLNFIPNKKKKILDEY
jgi:hypothetical protein